MTVTLLEQFLAEEVNEYVRALLRQAVNDDVTVSKRFEFNRFEVTIDRKDGSVLIEDVLDAAVTGALRMPIAEFGAALA